MANKKGWGRGWHLKKHFEAPNGKTYSYGKEIKGAKSKSQAKRKAVQKRGSSKKIQRPTSSKKKGKKKATRKKQVETKSSDEVVQGKETEESIEDIEIREIRAYQLYLDGKAVSALKTSEIEAEKYRSRMWDRCGGTLEQIRNVFFGVTPKKKGWVVISPNGDEWECLNCSKKDTRAQYLRHIQKTRMPRGTKIEKIEE